MRIVIIKTSSIGDVLQSIPVAVHLKDQRPEAHITWVVEKASAPFLRSLSIIDQVIEIDTKTWRKTLLQKKTRQELEKALRELCKESFDVLIDLQGNTKSALFTMVASSKRKIGFAKPAEWPNRLFTTEKFTPISFNKSAGYLESLEVLFGQKLPKSALIAEPTLQEAEKTKLASILHEHFQNRQVLLVCPGSRWENKKLAPQVLDECLQALQNAYPEVTIGIVAQSSQEIAAAESLIHKDFIITDITLPIWHQLMQASQGILTVDSAALHLAQLTDTPIFSLFGPSQAAVYHEKKAQDASFQGTCPYEIEFAVRCPKLRTCPTGACIKNRNQSLINQLIAWWRKRPT